MANSNSTLGNIGVGHLGGNLGSIGATNTTTTAGLGNLGSIGAGNTTAGNIWQQQNMANIYSQQMQQQAMGASMAEPSFPKMTVLMPAKVNVEKFYVATMLNPSDRWEVHLDKGTVAYFSREDLPDFMKSAIAIIGATDKEDTNVGKRHDGPTLYGLESFWVSMTQDQVDILKTGAHVIPDGDATIVTPSNGRIAYQKSFDSYQQYMQLKQMELQHKEKMELMHLNMTKMQTQAPVKVTLSDELTKSASLYERLKSLLDKE